MRQILLLRGINLGPNRRVPMADLRALLGESGYENVQTYVQSGNVVLDSDASASELESDTGEAHLGEVWFLCPGGQPHGPELAAVVEHNPLGDLVTEPKRYQVSFLDKAPEPAVAAALEELVAETEAVAFGGREIYAWHPEGVARSKLWNKLAGGSLGVDRHGAELDDRVHAHGDGRMMREYVIADVFTEVALEGNPVAVFTDATGLSAQTMQRTARELNLSETVFVLGPQDGVDARVRIFTPATELPFAGHPVLGTAFVLGERDGGDLIGLLTGSGLVKVKLRRDGAQVRHGEMEQPIPTWAPFDRAPELLARARRDQLGAPR